MLSFEPDEVKMKNFDLVIANGTVVTAETVCQADVGSLVRWMCTCICRCPSATAGS
jgi:hypothetical protein